jgi:hypothetical protein
MHGALPPLETGLLWFGFTYCPPFSQILMTTASIHLLLEMLSPQALQRGRRTRESLKGKI